ncbi:MAG TPA: phytoene/squalene synthase family protein [Gammaproteobacteria bacterium]|nr:phytoene/squalene synthase family protein [Gammaproteobacteria bacterium]
MNDKRSEETAVGRSSRRQQDLEYQRGILPGVSRTFALTIPVLPERLADVVGNAYLLCRLADTIEDDIALSDEQKSGFHERFVRIVEGAEEPGPFSAELAPLLAPGTLDDERGLVANTPRVIRVTREFSDGERAALTRCVRIMCTGMPKFQRSRSLDGLQDLPALDGYCYYVAGVVGEMLTELFCHYSAQIRQHRTRMMQLAVSFGQGLQMTNILKDVWDDRRGRTCWLPRSVFGSGFDLRRLDELHDTPEFRTGLFELIGVAHAHLRNALDYTCLIPKNEVGIRRFCLWAIGLAVLTLRKIHRNPGYTASSQVKVSRRSVKATVVSTNLTMMSNRALRMIFDTAADGLPLAELEEYAPRVATATEGS